MSLRKVSYKAFVFSLFWRNQEKGEATDLAASQLLGSWLWGSTRVSALTGSELSATQWLRRCKALQHSSGIEPKTPDSLWPVLTTKPLVRINGLKKTVYDSPYFTTCNFNLKLNWFFCIQNCNSWIFQVEYQGQRILECKPLIDTSYSIWHRLELKYFHFAQFSS